MNVTIINTMLLRTPYLKNYMLLYTQRKIERKTKKMDEIDKRKEKGVGRSKRTEEKEKRKKYEQRKREGREEGQSR